MIKLFQLPGIFKEAYTQWQAERSTSMRRYMFITFAVPYILLFSLLMWVAERTANYTAVNGATERFELVSERTSESLKRLEDPARAWLAAMTRNPLQGIHALEDLALLRVHMSLLSRAPHLASVYFGNANGEFARVLNLVDGASRTAISAPAEARYAVQFVRPLADGKAQESLDFYDTAMRPLAGGRAQASEYDPRNRPWFAAARAKPIGEIVATPPYRFAFPAHLGITMSANLGFGRQRAEALAGASPEAVAALANNRTIGGVDFSLMTLSAHLASLKAGKKSMQAYIFDENGKLWAWSNAADFQQILDGGGTPALSNLPDSSQRALLEAAKQRERDKAAGLARDGQFFEMGAPGGQKLGAAVYAVARLGEPKVFVAVTDLSDVVFEDAYTLRWRLLLIGLAGLIGGGVVIAFLSRRLARPLREMAIQTKLLERFRFHEFTPQKSRIRELAQLQASLTLARSALAGYARFMPKPLVKHYLALRTDPKPGVESREVVAMYASSRHALHVGHGISDEGFQALSGLLHHVEGSRGVADRIDNHGLGALWNAPLIQGNPARRACEAAIQAIDWLDRARPNDQAPWPIFVGIDSGFAAVGNFGTANGRLIYTAAGQPMQRAADLSRYARRLSVPLLITQPVAEAVRKYYELTPVDLSEIGVTCYAIVQRKADANAMALNEVSMAEPLEQASAQLQANPGKSKPRRELDSLSSMGSNSNDLPSTG